jgi:xanthine/CO dehydrogenase XdhC/CoxF family maturation factor
MVYDLHQMREPIEILAAFERLSREGIPAALATVVAVGGSSYRRPGAQMLIGADGRTWGGISGGCLERDVARRGRGVIETGQPVLCRYDTTETPDDAIDGNVLQDLGRTPGVTLGCRGVIDLLIERLSPEHPGPLPLLRRVIQKRETIRVATLLRKSSNLQAQLCMRFHSDQGFLPDNAAVDREFEARVAELLGEQSGSAYGSIRHLALPGDRSADLFIETLRPPQSIVVYGGGSDVVPVLELAKTLGWHVTIVAGSGGIGAAERFAGADVLRLTDRDDPSGGVIPEADAAVVLMTHDVARDARILESLAGRPLRYLGMLGPRSRSERLLSQAQGTSRWNAFFPAGLDIGADQPELIALAIVTEIQAVLGGRPAGPLRDRPGPIYPRTDQLA